MGTNTVIALNDNLYERWPEEIKDALKDFENPQAHPATKGNFGWGNVASTGDANIPQVVVTDCNEGRAIGTNMAAEQHDLNVLAMILRAHGWSTQAPNSDRLEGPSETGYWAKNQKDTAEA